METPNIDAVKRTIKDLIQERYPNNSGVFLYGSCLFEQFSNVNDIDVVVLSKDSARQRLTALIHGKELHISLLSMDVFHSDGLESRFGEYYLNKVMNPCCIVNDSDDVREVITLGRRAKVMHVLTRTPRKCITFTALDLYKYIAYIRMIQFPHFATAIVRIFNNKAEGVMVDTVSSYHQILSNCLKTGLVNKVENNNYCLGMNVATQSIHKNDSPLIDFSIVPRYWQVFAEVHKGAEDISMYQHRHLNTLLRLGGKCQSAMASVSNNVFLSKLKERNAPN